MADALTREEAATLLGHCDVTIWCLVGKIRNFSINGVLIWNSKLQHVTVCVRLETDDAIAASHAEMSARQKVQIWRQSKTFGYGYRRKVWGGG